MNKKPAYLCKSAGCFSVAAIKGYCVDCADRLIIPSEQQGYSGGPRPSRVIAAPHGYLGTEIEFIAPTSTSMRRALRMGVVHSDCTVDGEIKMIGHCDREGRRVARTVHGLYLSGCVANRRCGLHVHISAAHISQTMLRAWFRYCWRT